MISQKFFYPLYKDFEKKHFAKLLDAVKKKYEFVGGKDDKIFFIKSLLYYQLITKDYRKILVILDKHLSPRTDIAKINSLIKQTRFETDLSWVKWLYEKEMIKLVNKLWRSKDMKIIGSSSQFNEFILRYLISIWLVDWAGPCFAVLKLNEKRILDLKKANKILSLWDFTKIFASY